MSEDEQPVGDARQYFKEGQRFVTPINGDSTRGFYESLLVEKPTSHLAIRYCVENGLFGGEKHESLLAQYVTLKSSGIFNANRLALERIAQRTGGVKRELKRELTDEKSPSPKKHKKHKKEKKKSKKEKKKKHRDDSD